LKWWKEKLTVGSNNAWVDRLGEQLERVHTNHLSNGVRSKGVVRHERDS
jgi:hypothetical protein